MKKLEFKLPIIRFLSRSLSSSSNSKANSPVTLAHESFESLQSSHNQNQPLPCLFTHGLLGSRTNWKSIAKAVNKDTGRKTVIFDLRNHGESPHNQTMNYDAMAEDIYLLSKHMGISKFALLGHSMGGRAVMTFAVKFPELIDKLVVVDVTPYNETDEVFTTMETYIKTLMSINFDPKSTLAEARKFADNILMNIEQNQDLRAFLLTNMTKNEKGAHWRPNLPVLLNFLSKIADMPQQVLNSQFKGPTLFIRGSRSPYIPEDSFHKTRKIFPNAQLVTINDAGHWPHSEKPREFLPLLINFIQIK